MQKTSIEWVKNPDGSQGYTWNPITGCLNHTSGLCKGGSFPCYAYKLANGRLKPLYWGNHNIALNDKEYPLQESKLEQAYNDPFYPRFWQSRLNEPLYVNPKGIFVCDMGELFGDWLPDGWVNEVFHTINHSPQHRFYLLTKQPQNLIKFSPFPDNCWVGVTATNYDNFDWAVFNLRDIKAKVKYISFEPLSGSLLKEGNIKEFRIKGALECAGINWLIIGAQTKPYRPPKIEWVSEIVEAAEKADVPVFLKDNLYPHIYKGAGGKRQEMPNCG